MKPTLVSGSALIAGAKRNVDTIGKQSKTKRTTTTTTLVSLVLSMFVLISTISTLLALTSTTVTSFQVKGDRRSRSNSNSRLDQSISDRATRDEATDESVGSWRPKREVDTERDRIVYVIEGDLRESLTNNLNSGDDDDDRYINVNNNNNNNLDSKTRSKSRPELELEFKSSSSNLDNSYNNISNFSESINNNNNNYNGGHRSRRMSSWSSSPGTNGKIFTNQFVIQVEGGEDEAKKVAERHGFIYLNHILGDFYHIEHRRLSRRSTSKEDRKSILDMSSIEEEPQVLRLERQVLKRRVKRDFIELRSDIQPQQPQLHLANRSQLRHSSAGSSSAQLLALGINRPANQVPARGKPQQQHSNAQSVPFEGHTSAGGGFHVATNNNNNRPNQQANGHVRPPNQQPIYAGGRYPQAHHQAGLARLGAGRLSSIPGDMISLGSTLQPELLLASDSIASVISSQHRPANNMIPNPMLYTTTTTESVSQVNNGSSMRPVNGSISSSKRAPFNDPSWPQMWYLDGGAKNGFDLNVMAAWKMGYTGKGIVITILDDGLEKDHPDLQANYDPMASFDINGDDADPMPRYDVGDSNRHGTRCAGEVAAVPDNNICSIGIAYNSKVGGVRMLDGDVTDAVEARSLGLNNQHIHIYSASWGPDDNGKTVDGPGELATRAFMDGVTNGRQGLGSIFVFASGNGGREHDNCNCDGYTNSIWTLSISSATENGNIPWYIESCSSTLATTYSSGSFEERQIATTDLHHSCTSSHTGTSASAPLAAGICALVLESNPKLTWRDMQHIVVRTAKPANLVAKDWRTNALGRNVSHAFGYGLMDAAAMILMAKQWTSVSPSITCEIKSPALDLQIASKKNIELKLGAKCPNIRFLEHVQSKVTLNASRRGDLHIYLISPLGTRSTLLAQRPNDSAEQGFKNWPFMTVHSWGEPPNGNWTLEVHNDGKTTNRASLKEWTLVLYGTKDDPNWHLDPRVPQALASSKDINQGGAYSIKPNVAPISSGYSPNILPPPISVHGGQGNSKQMEQQEMDLRGGGNHYNGSNWLNTTGPTQKQHHWSSQGTINHHQTGQQPANGIHHQVPAPTSTLSSYVNTLKNTITTTTRVPFVTFKMPVESTVSNDIHKHITTPMTAINKADFDIVSPAHHSTTVSPSTTTSSSNSFTTDDFSRANINNNHMKPWPPGFEINTTQDTKDNAEDLGIKQLDSNNTVSNIKTHPGPISVVTTTNGTTNELDGNQIDSKQIGKDYRSSGDQTNNIPSLQNGNEMRDTTLMDGSQLGPNELREIKIGGQGSSGTRLNGINFGWILLSTLSITFYINNIYQCHSRLK